MLARTQKRQHTITKVLYRCFSSGDQTERMRIAIVGGGAAGLSSALHLAPLVASNSLERELEKMKLSLVIVFCFLELNHVLLDILE